MIYKNIDEFGIIDISLFFQIISHSYKVRRIFFEIEDIS